MRVLRTVTPTPEQLVIIARNRPGVEIIRGAAGSGKTTTALLRLRSLIGTFVARKERLSRAEPVKILLLTYNRTLRGYIEELATRQATLGDQITLQIDTFARWAYHLLGRPSVVNDGERDEKIARLGSGIRLPSEFINGEVDYLLSRFLPDDLDKYLTTRRDGRGAVPRVDREMREAILEEVVRPYAKWKRNQRKMDWNDLAVMLATENREMCDIIIADETQDFSANQVRAIMNNVAEVHAVTFILDTAQRIYPRGFTWSEAGITIRVDNNHRLSRNYRNTIEIARFAAPLVAGISLGDDDATIPDFSKCIEHGPLPIIVTGKYSQQTTYALKFLKAIDLSQESVAFLHPAGWFNQHLKPALVRQGFEFVEITRKSDWPRGNENIALSTVHSAKGLEFDHIIMIGLNAEILEVGEGGDDDRNQTLRRLLAMGIGRGRKTVMLGYKKADRSALFDLFEPGTFKQIDL
jgi:DNA helicase IV